MLLTERPAEFPTTAAFRIPTMGDLPLVICCTRLGTIRSKENYNITHTDARSSASPSLQEQVLGIITGIVQGRCLVAAAELGLADALAKGPLPVDAIAAQTKTDADNVFRLMRALETIGIFKQVSPRVLEKHAGE